MRNGEVSYWWQARGLPPRRPSLPGGAEADVCIVGAGFTGLWTAYYLKRADPGLRVIVLEQDFAGFGASGRNGGWVTAGLPGSRSRYALSTSGHPRGRNGVRELERQLRETVDEVARVCAAEGIDAGLVKGGTLTVATSAAQDARLRQHLEHERSWGDGPGIVRYLNKAELDARLQVTGAAGALYYPDCARVQPANLVAGLAEAVTRSGVLLYEATRVTSISAGRARTPAGDVRAPYVLRCTEGFTAGLPGQHRTLLPMNSSMIITGPLSDAAWKTIGWEGCETLGDEAHAYIYAQRTADGRIALGGRGVPYRYGSGLDHDGAVAASTVAQLGRILRRMFPVTARASSTRGAASSACPGLVRHGHVDPRTGLGWPAATPARGWPPPTSQAGRWANLGPRRAQPAHHPALGGPPLTALGSRSPPAGPGYAGCTPCTARRTSWSSAGRSSRTSLLARGGRPDLRYPALTPYCAPFFGLPFRRYPVPRHERHRVFPARNGPYPKRTENPEAR